MILYSDAIQMPCLLRGIGLRLALFFRKFAGKGLSLNRSSLHRASEKKVTPCVEDATFPNDLKLNGNV